MTSFKPGQRVRCKSDGDIGTFVGYRDFSAGSHFITSAGIKVSNRHLDCEVRYESNGKLFAEASDQIELLRDN